MKLSMYPEKHKSLLLQGMLVSPTLALHLELEKILLLSSMHFGELLSLKVEENSELDDKSREKMSWKKAKTM